MKVTVTIGQDVKGEYHIIAGPNEDVNGQRDNLRAITDKNGKMGTGKNAVQLAQAAIIHSTKGRLLGRKF